ncbi:MAG: cytochrome b [Nitrospinales bacterium]
MLLKNNQNCFGCGARFFHWTISFLFLFQFAIAIVMTELGKEDAYRELFFMLHKSVGITILFLALFRILWRKVTPLPCWPETLTDFDKKLFLFTEWGLYLIMFLMPLSGYFMTMAEGDGFKFFGLFGMPDLVGKSEVLEEIGEFLHKIMGFLTVGFVGSHITLVLRQHVNFKDDFLGRMSLFKSEKAIKSQNQE